MDRQIAEMRRKIAREEGKPVNALQRFFGPVGEKTWRIFAERVGGHFVEGGFWKPSQVRIDHEKWTITLDRCVTGCVVFTRMRAPFLSRDDFRFTIYRRRLFGALCELLGMETFESGAAEFDADFIIKSNYTSLQVRAFFSRERIRRLIERQPHIYLAVRDNDGRFGTRLPDRVDELYVRVPGVHIDVERLNMLFELFVEVLNQLCRLGSASADDPWITLASGPGQGALPLVPTGSRMVVPFETDPKRWAA
jgi:hypothetical protein